MTSRKMERALEMVREAAHQEVVPYGGYITTFMGLTPQQVHFLILFWESHNPGRVIPEK